MMIRVLLDMDGVLACFTSGMCRAHKKPDPWLNGANTGEYGMDLLWGMEPAEFWRPAEEEFWAALDPTPECFELVEALEGMVGPERICILSSPSANPGCVPGKLRWLARHLPAYKRRFLFGPRKEFCASANNLLIDDWDKNVVDFRAGGGQAVLFPRPWNSLAEHAESALDHLKKAVADALGFREER